MMDPKEIFNLVQESKKYDQRTRVYSMEFSDFMSFLECYPDIKGVHYYNKSLVVSCPSNIHEIVIDVCSNEILHPIKTQFVDLDTCGQRNIHFLKGDQKELRQSDQCLLHANLRFPTVVVEVDYSNQTRVAFLEYLRSYISLSSYQTRYAIGFHCRKNSSGLYKIELMQVSFEDGDFVEKNFQIGNDLNGKTALESVTYMILDKFHLFPNKSYNDEDRYIKIDLQKFHSKAIARINHRNNLDIIFESHADLLEWKGPTKQS